MRALLNLTFEILSRGRACEIVSARALNFIICGVGRRGRDGAEALLKSRLASRRKADAISQPAGLLYRSRREALRHTVSRALKFSTRFGAARIAAQTAPDAKLYTRGARASQIKRIRGASLPRSAIAWLLYRSGNTLRSQEPPSKPSQNTSS